MAHSSGGFFMLQSDDSNVCGLTVESCGRSEFETFLELPHCLPGDGWDKGPHMSLQDEGSYRGLQDEGPYRRRQSEEPYRGLQSEEPYRGLQDERPYRGLQDEGPYRGQQDEGSYRRQQDHFPVRDRDPNLPLRNLPLSMQEKRKTRDRRQQQRLSIGCWESWWQSQRIARRRLREQVVRTMCGLQPWRKALHTIEGKFGVGVKAYFTFLRYLLYLNLIHCLVISGLALTPVLSGKHNLTHGFIDTDSVLDLFLLTGFVDRSPVFYRFYSPVFLDLPCRSSPLLFLLAIASLLTLSIIMVVRRTVIGYKHTWMLGRRYNHHFSYKVFCGWDFCTQVPESAVLQHSLIRNDIKLVLEEERFHQHVSQRTFRQRVQLYFVRAVLNFLVIVLLSASFYLIYYVTLESSKTKYGLLTIMSHQLVWATNEHVSLSLFLFLSLSPSQKPKLSLLVEYLTPITITMVNFLLPHLFRRISGFEDYSLTVQVNITLVRSIILKLACLAIFLYSLQQSIWGCWPPKVNCSSATDNSQNSSQHLPQCWENQFGKEMYKLWLLFVLFRCCEPAQKMFRGSQSSVWFHFTLLLGLLLTVVTLGINANTYPPSSDCGPFAGNLTLFNITENCVQILPDFAQKALRFFISKAFALLLIFVEIVFLTSFVSQGRANRRAIEGLKDILVMCSADKRFLVKKHSACLRTLKTSLSEGNGEDARRMEAVDPSEIQPPFTRSTSAPCGDVAFQQGGVAFLTGAKPL
ncbi:transmembrane channel-like protein 7 [Anguilla rostrata]|uniref:transmembrane channel-like protein 7 n=1 Tax=Anguilla rostrata TaxID=7938 RepID=UPI0030D5B25D